MSERMSNERLAALKDFYPYPENEPETMWAFHIREVLQGMDAEREEVERLREDLNWTHASNVGNVTRAKQAESRFNRLVGRLEKHHHADTCFSKLVPPDDPASHCDCWKSEIADTQENGDA